MNCVDWGDLGGSLLCVSRAALSSGPSWSSLGGGRDWTPSQHPLRVPGLFFPRTVRPYVPSFDHETDRGSLWPLSRPGSWSHILPCEPPGQSLRSAGQVRRGHESPSGVCASASPLLFRLLETLLLTSAVSQATLLRFPSTRDHNDVFKTSQNVTNRRVPRHEASCHSQVDFLYGIVNTPLSVGKLSKRKFIRFSQIDQDEKRGGEQERDTC